LLRFSRPLESLNYLNLVTDVKNTLRSDESAKDLGCTYITSTNFDGLNSSSEMISMAKRGHLSSQHISM
jgi:hypothetical protein